MPDLNGREWVAFAPMIILMIWMGIYPQSFLPSIGASNANTLAQTKGKIEQQVKTIPQAAQEVANAR
jgi:NADH-quinone oxidoreductase subunit M